MLNCVLTHVSSPKVRRSERSTGTSESRSRARRLVLFHLTQIPTWACGHVSPLQVES